MRAPLTGYILTALVTAAVIFLIATACSWDILTRGEILKDDEAVLEDLEIPVTEIVPVPLDTLPAIALDPPDLEIIRDTPDTIAFSLTSTVTIDNQERYLIEMEVGELLQGQGEDPDTVLVDHRP